MRPSSIPTSAHASTHFSLHEIFTESGEQFWVSATRYRHMQEMGLSRYTPSSPFIIDPPEPVGEWITREEAAKRVSLETGVGMSAARRRIDRAVASGKIDTREDGKHTQFNGGDVSTFILGYTTN